VAAEGQERESSHVPGITRSRWRQRVTHAILVGTGIVLAFGAYRWWTRPRPVDATEIFRGVTYRCLQLPDGTEGRGLAHIVQVDLAAPGVGLYVTPLDEEAVARGFEYRLGYAKDAAAGEGLAVVINGAMFSSDSGWLPRKGDLARGLETVVAEHRVSHPDPNTYLLWFEDDLSPHLDKTKPPPPDALRRARWGIGGQGVALRGGRVSRFAGHQSDRRTIVGIDPQRRLLWLAVFENASPWLAAKTLAEQGATEAMLLDGGDSTTMFVAHTAASGQTGTLVGGWRPVATFLGVRALPPKAD
jgi:hypothetical protein